MNRIINKDYIQSAKGTFLSLWLCIFLTSPVLAQSITSDTIRQSTALKEVEIIGSAPARIRVLDSGAIQLNSAGMALSGRSLGEMDYIAAMKRLAGVSAVSDYGSGISIDGASPSHSLFRIEGAPVFFPYRFGGIFSTFNPYYFNRAIFEPGFHHGSMPSRLGGIVDFTDSRPHPEQVKGTANVGLLSSSAALQIPVGKRISVSAAARISYVDELYGALLNAKKRDISYQFYDLNLSAAWDINSTDRLKFSGLLSSDRLSFDDKNYTVLMKLRWKNSLATIGWEHSGDVPVSLRVWYSGFKNTLGLSMPQFAIISPASIKTVGGSGEITFRKNRNWEITAGAEYGHYHTIPQWTDVRGSASNLNGNRPDPTDMTEARLFSDLSIPTPEPFGLSVGVSASRFIHNDYHTYGFDPRITLSIVPHPLRLLRLHVGSYRQYLHQSGFSDIGLASDFWAGSTKKAPAQHLWDFSAEYSASFPEPALRASVMVYYKIVMSQPEFSGQLLDIVDASYDYQDNLIVSRGFNTGINMSVEGQVGSVRFNGSYSWGVARRHVSKSSQWWRSIFSPGHSLKLDADMTKKRWTFGASFSLASGRVYTPAKAIYLIANNLATVYGKRNSARMPLYHRLDLSASYSFTTGTDNRLRHLVNLSFINVYGHNNVDMQYYAVSQETGGYKFKRVSSLYRFLPSVSYSISF